MKRKCVVILIISLLLSGCSSKSTPSKGQQDSIIDTESLTEIYTDAWSIEDLSFYDEEKKESVFLTKEHRIINLSENIDLQTYRNVRIGDRATTALKKYNLSDFVFGFDPIKYIKSDTKNKEAEEVADELAQKYESLSASEMLDNIKDVNTDKALLYFAVDLYEDNGSFYKYTDITEDILYKDRYTIIIDVKDEKIDDFAILKNTN